MQADILTLFRKFRHDLLNELQILSGHLQLGRPTDVLRKDVQAVIDRVLEVSQLFSCRNDRLAVLLWAWLEQARDLEVSVSFDLAGLAGSPAEAGLNQAASLIAALLPEISRLEDEERWLHVRVDGAGSALVVVAPLLPVPALAGIFPATQEAAVESAGDQLEFVIPLSQGPIG